jgi:hypothetical protein
MRGSNQRTKNETSLKRTSERHTGLFATLETDWEPPKWLQKKGGPDISIGRGREGRYRVLMN